MRERLSPWEIGNFLAILKDADMRSNALRAWGALLYP